MIVSSSPPLLRVHEILQRMQTDSENVECLKTCCGALAILAKDEANKLLIARDGTRLILTVMEGHSTRPDLQEAVCDLLWSLAFNNGLVKEVVGRQGGIALILKGMSSHLSSPELIKSACGALSNMCQNTYNQNIIAAHGGVRTILSALHSHRMNAPLLPFVFDALASLIVGNQRNGLLVTDGGGIRGVLTTMALHSNRREVVKSGCHALAILSDIQGQGARIAGADGVKVLLPALRAHVRFLHLHRIAAIVLLRMLQEAAVARDIASHGGVVIMLGMLREHAKEEETVAATVHILYLITHADVMSGGIEVEVGRHFSGIPPPSPVPLRGIGVAPAPSRGGGTTSSGSGSVGNSSMRGAAGGGVECSSITDRELFSTGSVRALVLVLQAHMERKDIVRAAMRSAANLIRVRSVVRALVAEVGALPTVLQCLAMHTTSRGITDSAVAVAGALLGAAHKGGGSGNSPNSLKGSNDTSLSPRTSGSNTGRGANHFNIAALGAIGCGQQRPTPRPHQPAPQGSIGNGTPTRSAFGLRFAYCPFQDNRSGGTVETGLRGHGSKTTSATTATTTADGATGVPAAVGRRATGQAGQGARGTPLTAAAACKGSKGDSGGWNASMQALCAMLRARRRDPALAGLVFLALEACIVEWDQACDAKGLEQHQHQHLPRATGAKGGGWHDLLECIPPAEQPPGALATATKTVALERPIQHGVATDARLFPDQGPQNATERATLSAPREYMHLGIRESLKAGLVWAEAVPLCRSQIVAGVGGERRGSGTGGAGSNAVGKGDQAVAAVGLSFNLAMSGAVERLCRLLRKGFVEMGFGRSGSAVPLGGSASMLAFDTNVAEVLEALRSARQPSASRESVEHLMRMFLPDEPPEPPPIEAQEVDPVAVDPGSALEVSETSVSAGPKDGSGRSCGGGCGKGSDAADTASSARGLNPFNPRRSGAGKAATVGATAGGDNSVGGVSSPRGAGAFWDEAGAGGAGLVTLSPLELEPTLLPSSVVSTGSTAVEKAASDAEAAAAASSITAGVSNGFGGGGAGASTPTGSGTCMSRHSGGAGGGGATGSDDRLWLVYDGASAAGKGVISRVNAPDPYWLGRASPGSACPHTHSMEFHSSFESANLLRAVQRGPAEYDLFLRPDLHTHGHTQWFYFAVRGTHPPGVVGESVVKFNVVNLTKPDSLFAMGMRPVLYSHRDAAVKGLGWRRCGHGIEYRSNGYSWYKPDGSQASFYTLSLSVTFHNPGDTYRLAHAHPYTYSDHKRHLAKLLADERTSKYLGHKVLCTTLGGNECDLLTVTDFEDTPITAATTATATGSGRGNSSSSSDSCPPTFSAQGLQQPRNGGNAPLGAQGATNGIEAPTKLPSGVGRAGGESGPAGASDFNGRGGGRRGQKRCVVISARVHPGETPASWMMRGMLDFITGESAEARLLRSLFVFKVVPMVNPDGVAFGNNRCSLAGVDLNRQWKRPSRALHPTVFWMKQLIRQEQARKGVAMYIDLHGHSRKMNIFMYGADEKRRGLSCPSARVFPKLLSWNRLGRKYVSFKDCSFAVKKGRESTARVVVARDLGIGNSYTVESTFCGVDFGPLKDHHLNTNHLQEAGVAICDAMLDYFLPLQAQRERAHRDLLVRDGIEESARSLGLPSPTVTVAAASPSMDGGGGASNGMTESAESGGNEGGVLQDSDDRDADDDVVDNNDDIESEDDTDSVPPEASPEEPDVDQESDHISRCLRRTPPDYNESASRPPIGAEGEELPVDAPSVFVTHGGSGGDYDKKLGLKAEEWRLETAIGGSGGESGGGGGGGGNEPWPGIDWAEGESGRAGAVRRWGRVVEEIDGEDDGVEGGGDFEPSPAGQPPSREAQADDEDIADDDGREEVEKPGAKGRGRKRWGGREKRERGSVNRDRGDGIAARSAVGAAGANTVGGGPTSSGGKKDRRRTSGSRAPKALSLTNGNRGRGGDRSSTRQHRPRGYGSGGDGAARRASDAALQAASKVLVACNGSTSTVESRRRIRSLNGGGASSNILFTPDPGSGGSGSGSGKGRGRGRGGGGGGSPSARSLTFSSAAGDLESAPRSGSSLDTRDAGLGAGAGVPTTVVKRGGNPRWLSSTEPTAAGGLERNWSAVGSLTLPRRISPTPAQAPSTERINSDARSRQEECSAPESGNDFARSGGGSTGRGVKGIKGGGTAGVVGGGVRGRAVHGRAVHGRSVVGSGGGERGDASSAMLPVLEDVAGGGAGARAGGRQEEWPGGHSSSGIFASRVPVPARGQS